jgi:hypothetical protein
LVPLATNPPGAALVGQTTVNASGGVASYSGLSFNLPGSYIIQASATELIPANILAITLSPPPPQSPIVSPVTVLTHQNKNRKGKPVGPKVLLGYQFAYSLPMSGSAGIPSNYLVQTNV